MEIITMHLNILVCFWTLVPCCGLTFETLHNKNIYYNACTKRGRFLAPLTHYSLLKIARSQHYSEVVFG